MLDQAPDLSADQGALRRAQVRHLLDQVGKVELEVRTGLGEAAQRVGLALRPDVEVRLLQVLDAGGHGACVLWMRFRLSDRW